MSAAEVRPCGDDRVLSLRHITKTYNTGELAVPVLKGISFDIYRGQFVGILGTSGSGKSTMLNILGMLDVPTGGEYTLEGIPVGSLADREQAAIRNRKIGFVFQSFNLFSYLTVEQNIEVPMIYNRVPRRARRQRRSGFLARSIVTTTGLWSDAAASGVTCDSFTFTRAAAPRSTAM